MISVWERRCRAYHVHLLCYDFQYSLLNSISGEQFHAETTENLDSMESEMKEVVEVCQLIIPVKARTDSSR